MRLTLRTLMAYLDGVLEPADRADVGQKLEESESAQGVLNHIRDVTHRVRLGTPKLTAKGLGGDPNTVAEYLDHSMHNERVQEFEKVCLESDVQLAEVADCHQILALVLGQPAEVDPESRRRMYAVIEHANDPVPPVVAAPVSGVAPAAAVSAGMTAATVSAATVSAAQSAASAVVPAGHPTDHAHVPDYLLADRKAARRNAWLLVGAAALVLLGVARIVAPFDAAHPLVAWTGMNGGAAKDNTSEKTSQQNADPNPTPPAPGNLGPQNTTPPSVDPAVPMPAVENPATHAAPLVAGSAPVVLPTENLDAGAAPANAAAPTDGAALVNGAPDAGKSPPALPTPADGSNPNPAIPVTQATDVAGATTASVAGDGTIGAVPPAPMPPTPAPSAPAAPAPGGLVGRMTQDGSQVLLAWRETNEGGSWVRVPGAGTVGSGDRLLSLHTYRPGLTLKNGVGLQLVGETQIEIYNTPNEEIPMIRIHFGKVVLANNGRADAKVAIEPGVKRTGLLTLNDPDSLVAIEVVRALPLGANPEKIPAQVASTLYAVQGRYQWQPETTVPAPAPLAAPQRQILNGPAAGPPATVDTKAPLWITKNDLSNYDLQASGPFQALLVETQPIAVTLRELAGGNRRGEIRYLAARSLALIDEFDLFIDSFSDPDQKAVWTKEIEALQAALARGPETAALIRQAITKQRPDYGEQLYRYLWGCNREDLVAGYADELLDGLDNENLDMRVVAFNILREAVRDPKSTSAPPTYNYTADATSITARQQAARQWRANIKELIKRLPAAPTVGPAIPAAPAAPATLDQLP